MQLSIRWRHVGQVTILTCVGRIVAGPEVKYLHDQVTDLIPGSRYIVLQLAEVTFLDSSGMGTLLRLLNRLKAGGIKLGLCVISAHVKTALTVTNLLSLFAVYGSEEEAVAAAYDSPVENSLSTSAECVLCIGDTSDVRAYLGAVVRAADYQPLTCGSLYDAKILLRAGKPKLIIVGSQSLAVEEVMKELKQDSSLPILGLDEGFATQAAGEAGNKLVAKIREILAPTRK